MVSLVSWLVNCLNSVCGWLFVMLLKCGVIGEMWMFMCVGFMMCLIVCMMLSGSWIWLLIFLLYGLVCWLVLLCRN